MDALNRNIILALQHQSSRDSQPFIGSAVVRGLLIAISNNKADQEYLRLGTGIESVHLPSLCMYTQTTLDVEEAKEHKVSLTLQWRNKGKHALGKARTDSRACNAID